MCAKHLSGSLNNVNIFECLKMAFQYKNEELKLSTVDYVTTHNVENNFHQILKSAEWKELLVKESALATEILDAIFEEAKFLG
jgi:hypothetical protein